MCRLCAPWRRLGRKGRNSRKGQPCGYSSRELSRARNDTTVSIHSVPNKTPCIDPGDSSSLSRQPVLRLVISYNPPVPKLWTETIAAHRRAVIDATLDPTAALVAEHGLRGVTMSA